MHTPPVKMWKDMSPEEKGALLLAHHEGKTIQFLDICKDWVNVNCKVGCNWYNKGIYRVRPEPKIVKKNFFYSQDRDCHSIRHCATHTISFNIIDGEIDCSSVKMEKV